MQRILVDHARPGIRRSAGEEQKVRSSRCQVSLPEKSVEFLAVDESGLDRRSRLALQAGKFARSRGSGRRRGQIPI
jgi:hypothetical protein